MLRNELVAKLRQEENFVRYADKVFGDFGGSEMVANGAIEIWRTYARVFPAQYVKRSGYCLFGCTELEISEMRAQSVLEHQYLTVAFLKAVRRNFAGLFKKKCWDLMEETLLFHDLGEIETGDVPDDGTMRHSAKHVQEEQALREMLDGLSPNAKKILRQVRLKSGLGDAPAGAHAGSESELAMAAVREKIGMRMARFTHLVDKVSALLDLCCYEFLGRPGSLATKQLNGTPTERDLHASEMTESVRPLDIWGYSLVKISKLRSGYDFDAVFEGVLRAAIWDVRGEGASWLDRVLMENE